MHKLYFFLTQVLREYALNQFNEKSLDFYSLSIDQFKFNSPPKSMQQYLALHIDMQQGDKHKARWAAPRAKLTHFDAEH